MKGRDLVCSAVREGRRKDETEGREGDAAVTE
jgi:hypothetical protein